MARIDYVAPPTVARFMQSKAVVSGITGPYGSGKSVGCCMRTVMHAMQQEAFAGVRKSRFAITRNTKVQLKKTTIKTWLQWLPDGVAGTFHKTELVYELKFNLPDRTSVLSEIHFMGLDTDEDRQNLLSFELTGCYMNEFREQPFNLVKDLLGRIGRYPIMSEGGPSWSGIFGDTNPYDVDSEWYQVFDNPNSETLRELQEFALQHKLKMPSFECFHQPGGFDANAENLENLLGGRQYYFNQLALAKSEGRDENWINVHIHGKPGFTMDGKPVYGRNYSSELHLAKTRLQPAMDRAIGVGMDFGLTPAAVFGYKDARGFWIILDELVAREQMGTEQFEPLLAAFARERWPGHKLVIYADPAGEQKSQADMKSSFDVLRSRGYTVWPSEQSPALRLDSVRSVLRVMVGGTPAFQMNSTCSFLHRGFIGGDQYRKMKVSGDRYADKPDKN